MKLKKLSEDMRERGLIPLAEAARLLEIDHSYAWKLVQAGTLTGERQGSWWFVTQESVDHFREKLPLAAGPRRYEVTLARTQVAYRTVCVVAESMSDAGDRAKAISHGIIESTDKESVGDWCDSKDEGVTIASVEVQR